MELTKQEFEFLMVELEAMRIDSSYSNFNNKIINNLIDKLQDYESNT